MPTPKIEDLKQGTVGPEAVEGPPYAASIAEEQLDAPSVASYARALCAAQTMGTAQ